LNIAFKIAWRNIWKHRGKSLVIGGILFLGSVLMTVGNGMIAGMEKGLADNIVNRFSGDIVVVSDEQKKDNVLFDMAGSPLKVIKSFANVTDALDNEAVIKEYLPVAAGTVYLLNPGSEMGKMMLLGVDIARYMKVFPGSFQVTEGRVFRSGESGVLVGEEARNKVYNMMNFWIVAQGRGLDRRKLPENALSDLENLDIKRDLVFMGAGTSNATLDIRVPVTGIIHYKALNKIWGSYSIVDIDSFRKAHNYVTEAESNAPIDPELKKLLDTEDVDQLFASGDFIDNKISRESGFAAQEVQLETERNQAKDNIDHGAYNLVLVRLRKGVSVDGAVKRLNQEFGANHLQARAISWKKSVGIIGSMAVLLKSALNMFVMFIFFVAMIVIMNTLSMAAMERISELGMMRAIGARKGFLKKMFSLETGILAFFFGGIGMMAGITIIYLLGSGDVHTANEMLQLIYGGSKLSPVFTFDDLLIGGIELGIVTLISVLYPLRLVSKIVPLDAVVRE
jgi:ABC-type lipoprotein release transport system permease subunit